jgi:hypothetical protein
MAVLFVGQSSAQTASSLRKKTLLLQGDTIVLDTFSIVKGSFQFLQATSDTTNYILLEDEGILIRKKGVTNQHQDSVKILFRVFPFNFTEPVRNKERRRATAQERGIYNPFVYTPGKNNENLLKFEGLNKAGSISRGISVGNNQDLSVNSTLNLQLSGKLSSDIDISAAITDDNIPIQPDGNTQQLQDFDRVYIQLSNEKSKLIVGDFQITRPESYFMNFNKRLQGGSFETRFKTALLDEKKHLPANVKIGASAAVARGRFSRNQIQGVEGNQGPYRLRGTNNEQFIIILSGSEKVYIDGKQLKRGQEYDYIIDYNSAELTFTSRRIITKDLRIFVEFEYSDKNYARSLLYFNNEIEQGKLSTRINLYTEQDSRNQPLQQQLTGDQKSVLTEAGDNFQDALISSVDSVGFSPDLILYTKQDTLVNSALYQEILVFSTNPETAIYKASFSNVGANKGDYVQVNSVANGRVFKWVAPIDGVPQGSYVAKTQLIPPTKKQLVTFGADYRFSKNLKLTSEIAYSNYDVNTFSNIGNNDNEGYAFRIAIENSKNLGKDSLPWKLVSTLSYEQIDKYFNPLERFRTVEFDRDWNIPALVNQQSSEYLPRANINLSRSDIGTANYLFTAFLKGDQLQASQHALNSDFKFKGFGLSYNGSLTDSKGNENNSLFYRHRTLFSKDIRWIQLGYKDEFERNLLQDSKQDTLRFNSYTFFDRQAFIQNVDTSKQKFSVFYRVRTDEGVLNKSLKEYAWAESYGFTVDLSSNENIQFRTSTSIRRLEIRDTLLSKLKPERTLVNRVELSIKALKSSIQSSTFYEAGSGLESRKEFSYLEVQPGQGVYAWTDYNSNGIKELNEFEISAFPDQAKYIRVFTPTTDFIRVYSNSINEAFNLKAPKNWSQSKGLKRFAARISTQSALRFEGRTTNTNLLEAYNPFLAGINDSSLITLNQTLRNSIFFNKSDPKFGFDLNWQKIATKALLNNGLEARENKFSNHRFRWSPGNRFIINGETRVGKKESNTAFYSTRNYRIRYFEIEPKFSYQPNAAFLISLLYKRSEKNNDEGLGGERAISETAGLDLKYNVANKGSFQANVKFILIKFDGIQNTSVAFEMQEGLKNGNNYTWGLTYQRTLSNNMQINFNYDGRKTADTKTIHIGGVQVRVFF